MKFLLRDIGLGHYYSSLCKCETSMEHCILYTDGNLILFMKKIHNLIFMVTLRAYYDLSVFY